MRASVGDRGGSQRRGAWPIRHYRVESYDGSTFRRDLADLAGAAEGGIEPRQARVRLSFPPRELIGLAAIYQRLREDLGSVGMRLRNVSLVRLRVTRYHLRRARARRRYYTRLPRSLSTVGCEECRRRSIEE